MPEMVTAKPPIESEELPIAKPVGAAVKICPPTVYTDCKGVGRATVEEPIWRPEEPRETTVPETVIAEPPIESEELPMAKPVGAPVNVWPPTVKIG